MSLNLPFRRYGLLPGALALVAGASALSGCSNNPYPPGTSEGTTMLRNMPVEPRSYDPSFSYTTTEALVLDNICPGFYQYHYLKRPFVLELYLGAKEPERKPATFQWAGKTVQGEEWTFTLKKGIRFQDSPCFRGGKGREVVAADIAYAFQRMADPKIKCPIASFLSDKLIGFAEAAEAAKNGGFDYSKYLEGAKPDPNDPYTLRIRLNQAYPQLRYLMAMHFTTPIAREAVEHFGSEFKWNPVGCGPYMMTELNRKQRIVLTANPNRLPETYPSEGEKGDAERGLLKDAGKRLPLAEKIVFNINKETITGWNFFLQGYLDTWNLTAENFAQAVSTQGAVTPEMAEKGISPTDVPGADIRYHIFNMKDPVVGGYTPQKRKLRQALALAADATEYIDVFSMGKGIPAQSLIPPGIFGYDPSYRNPYRVPDSLAKAKQLLAEAGYPEGQDAASGERLTIYYDSPADDAGERQIVLQLVKQLERLGVKVQTRFWRQIVWQDKVDKGQFQLVTYGWSADYPDAENFTFLLYGPNRRPGPNASNYDNPEYNRLFEQMRAMDDSPERLKLIHRLRDIAAEDCPLILREHTVVTSLSYAWHTNVKPHAVANDFLKYRGTNAAMRVQMQRKWNDPVYWPSFLGLAAIGLIAFPAAQAVKQRQRRKLRKGDAAGTGTVSGRGGMA